MPYYKKQKNKNKNVKVDHILIVLFLKCAQTVFINKSQTLWIPSCIVSGTETHSEW